MKKPYTWIRGFARFEFSGSDSILMTLLNLGWISAFSKVSKIVKRHVHIQTGIWGINDYTFASESTALVILREHNADKTSEGTSAPYIIKRIQHIYQMLW